MLLTQIRVWKGHERSEEKWRTLFPKLRAVCSYTSNVGRVLRLRRNTHWQDHTSFDSPLSRAGLGHLGKDQRVDCSCGTTARKPCWANGLFYPSWNRLYSFTVANCQALTWHLYYTASFCRKSLIKGPPLKVVLGAEIQFSILSDIVWLKFETFQMQRFRP